MTIPSPFENNNVWLKTQNGYLNNRMICFEHLPTYSRAVLGIGPLDNYYIKNKVNLNLLLSCLYQIFFVEKMIQMKDILSLVP